MLAYNIIALELFVLIGIIIYFQEELLVIMLIFGLFFISLLLVTIIVYLNTNIFLCFYLFYEKELEEWC